MIITWSTASEVNNDYFTIAESIDGVNWKTLVTIEGSGNSKETRYYSRTVLSKISGVDIKYVRCHRLITMGLQKIFPAALIQDQSTPADIKVYPNPMTNGEFHINTGSSDLAEIELFNFRGIWSSTLKLSLSATTSILRSQATCLQAYIHSM